MKVEELRIGNLVSYEGVGEVKVIVIYGATGGVELEHEGGIVFARIEDVSPIAFRDDEVLKRFGWHPVNPNAGAYGHARFPYLYAVRRHGYQMPYGKTMHFVHELQNRVYSLTGIELIVSESL